ncbi:MAG: NADH-quinone oxidoreductase subunit N [Desulfobulbus sp.]|nr:MAG: NADH-quinone oxidoreductase subunit N [Desulfobulbus sp.]
MTILPELALVLAALSFFGLSLTPHPDTTRMRNAAVFFGALVFIGTVITLGRSAVLFDGSLQVDRFSQFFKLMISSGLFFVLVGTRKLYGIARRVRPEYYMFLFLSCLGLMLLVSATELITLFVALELSSFSLYLMVPMRDEQTGRREQMEAGIKYILFGVLATGFMLYGMSYIFGLTGTTYLGDIALGLRQTASRPAAFFAVVLVLAGFFYKLALFPMHFWVPDVYEGAANETTTFVATVPKLGAVALLIRFVVLVPGDAHVLVTLMMVLALCSMFYGNLIALVQTDVKRMLGYSGIAHAGFILFGLLTMKSGGYAMAMYYISGYVFMNIACYTVLCHVSEQGENLSIGDLAGLHKREPFLAFLLALGLFALAGIPPMVGFTGEFMLLAGVLKEGPQFLIPVILAAINAGIAIYYYLSVIKSAYTADDGDRGVVSINPLTRISGTALMVIIVLMGIFPSRIIAYADAAVKAIM